MSSPTRQLALLLAVILFAGLARPVGALTEGEYRQKARKLGAVTVYSAAQIQQARSRKPEAALEVCGNVGGVLQCPDGIVVIIRLPDGQSAELKTTTSLPSEVQAGVSVKALARGKASLAVSALEIEAITIDNGRHITPAPAPYNPALALTSIPAPAPAAPAPLSSRGGEDRLLTCKRAIAYFNPRLPSQNVDNIASSIVTYSGAAGVDPYLVVALVAAESRFNPNACSYKGAMGLGQLMPGTANGLGVGNPYDPTQNLAGAIRLLQGHLAKYQGQSAQVALALAAYNAGSGAVARHGGVPPYRETRNYIWKVYEYYCWMYGVQPESRY
jgi:soluble lytic murein transglycosylase-like protein